MIIDTSCDAHMHTVFSDGSASIDGMAASAVEKGLSQISITDHMPLPCGRRYAMAKNRVDEYRQAVRDIQYRYSGQLTVSLGIEMEFIPEFRFWVRSIVEMGWQTTIASVHSLRCAGRLYIVNGTEKEFTELVRAFGGDIRGLLRAYFDSVCAALETGWFDIAGHLDVVKKHNADEKYFSESDPYYREMVLGALESIRRKNMKMEINMSGLDHPVKEQYPSRWIIREAMNRNIPIVLSSDAHAPEDIGRHFRTIDNCIENKVAVSL